MATKKTIKEVKTGLFSRGLTLARLSVSAGTQMAVTAVSNAFSDEASSKDRFSQLMLSQAGRIAKELGELKGTAMKAGQMLSMYGERLLPPEVNKILKTLQSDSPVVEWSSIEKVLKRQLGIEKMALLEIEKSPIASASIGQVHLATIKSTGEKIVLKVQYPGVDAAIESDLRALKRILSLTQILPKGAHMDEIFKEIREMMHQEVNYENELKEMIEYKALLKDDHRFIIAQPYPEFSSKRVLASQFLEGVGVDSAEVASLSQERRNKLAAMALDLYFTELVIWGRVQTDPHLGNYRIRLDIDGKSDQIILFDFGAVRHFPKKFLVPYIRMVRGAMNKDRDEVILAGGQLGFLKDTDSIPAGTLFYELCSLIMEPFHSNDPSYEWSKGDLPKRAIDKAKAMVLALGVRQPPREIVFLDRKMGGVYIFLSVLNAQMTGRKEIEAALKSSKY